MPQLSLSCPAVSPVALVKMTSAATSHWGDPPARKEEGAMQIEKLLLQEPRVIPVIAALPYRIVAGGEMDDAAFTYDARSQTTLIAGSSGSWSRYEESVSPLFGKSRSDTQKDD